MKDNCLSITIVFEYLEVLDLIYTLQDALLKNAKHKYVSKETK